MNNIDKNNVFYPAIMAEMISKELKGQLDFMWAKACEVYPDIAPESVVVKTNSPDALCADGVYYRAEMEIDGKLFGRLTATFDGKVINFKREFALSSSPVEQPVETGEAGGSIPPESTNP